MAGFECLLLPGWVLDSEHVHWLDVKEGGDSCKRRDQVLRVKLVKRYKSQLDEIRKQVDKINRETDVPSIRAVVSNTTNKR